MAVYLAEALTALKATWDATGHKKATGADITSFDKTLLRAFLMIDTDSFATFMLRAPTAVHFGISSIEAPTTATLWRPNGSGTTSTTSSVNELFGANIDYVSTPLRMEKAAGKLARLKLRTPIPKTRSDRTGDQTGSFPNTDGKNINIRWLNQHFPEIASSDYVCAFFGENAATPPLQIIIGGSRKFLKSTGNPKPSELKPLNKQIEGRKGAPAATLWAQFG